MSYELDGLFKVHGVLLALEVAPGERVEIVASFVDPGGDLGSARILVERLSPVGSGSFLTLVVPLSGTADNVEYVFAA